MMSFEVAGSYEVPDTRGPAIIITGSLGSGIGKTIGPFESIEAAIDWAIEERILKFGHMSIHLLENPSDL